MKRRRRKIEKFRNKVGSKEYDEKNERKRRCRRRMREVEEKSNLNTIHIIPFYEIPLKMCMQIVHSLHIHVGAMFRFSSPINARFERCPPWCQQSGIYPRRQARQHEEGQSWTWGLQSKGCLSGSWRHLCRKQNLWDTCPLAGTCGRNLEELGKRKQGRMNSTYRNLYIFF